MKKLTAGLLITALSLFVHVSKTDAAIARGGAGQFNGSGTSISQGISISGSELYIAVMVSVNNGSDVLSTPTLSGVPMTLVAKNTFNAGTWWQYTFIQAAPAAGTPTFAATLSGSSVWAVKYSYFTGAIQTNTVDTYTTSSSPGGVTGITQSLTTIATDTWITLFVPTVGDVGAVTDGADTDLINGDGNGVWFERGVVSGAPGLKTMSATWANSRAIGGHMISVAPFASAPVVDANPVKKTWMGGSSAGGVMGW